VTRKDKATLLKAACRIACGQSYYSCVAIASTEGESTYFVSSLVRDYARFYNKHTFLTWFDDFAADEETITCLRNQRILLLLWFREVGLEGIGLE
jgi:hypothetical protein